MKTAVQIRKSACLATIIGLAAMLGGCGGGDDKKKAENNVCFDNPLNFLWWVTNASSTASTSGSGVAGSGSDSGVAATAE